MHADMLKNLFADTGGEPKITQALILNKDLAQLYENHLLIDDNRYMDVIPVCRLYSNTNRNIQLLVCSMSPDLPDMANAIVDNGRGVPELDEICLSELSELMHPLYGYPIIERDRHWRSRATIRDYLNGGLICEKKLEE